MLMCKLDDECGGEYGRRVNTIAAGRVAIPQAAIAVRIKIVESRKRNQRRLGAESVPVTIVFLVCNPLFGEGGR
jgi:enoyl-[acyl-carrier-protein] reductase (NADH)